MFLVSKFFLKVLLISQLVVFNFSMKIENKPTYEKKKEAPYVAPILAIADHMHPNLPAVFVKRMTEYMSYVERDVITLIDFSLPSTSKRLWTIDLGSGEVLYNSFVAHGRNSGENYAEKFSNRPQSYQSSLGFYVTGAPYIGKHGKSLRLHGLEKDVNDKAYERAIVIHGADYVEEAFIRHHGRLGRSHGCPAIPKDLTEDFINTVKDGTLLFIFHPQYEPMMASY